MPLTLRIFWTTPSLYKNIHIPIDLICCSYSGKPLETAKKARKDHKLNKMIYVFPYIGSSKINNSDYYNEDSYTKILIENSEYINPSFQMNILPFIKNILWVNKNIRKDYNSKEKTYIFNIMIITDLVFLYDQFNARRVKSFITQDYNYENFFKDCYHITKPEWDCRKLEYEDHPYKIFL